MCDPWLAVEISFPASWLYTRPRLKSAPIGPRIGSPKNPHRQHAHGRGFCLMIQAASLQASYPPAADRASRGNSPKWCCHCSTIDRRQQKLPQAEQRQSGLSGKPQRKSRERAERSWPGNAFRRTPMRETPPLLEEAHVDSATRPQTVCSQQMCVSIAQASLWRLTGSMTLVFLSTASTTVRCSDPSRLQATIGKSCRRSGKLILTVKVPSGRSFTGSPESVT